MSGDVNARSLESMVSIMVGEQMKSWTQQIERSYTERYNEMLQERKETLAIVNRLGKYVENVDNKVNTISEKLQNIRSGSDGDIIIDGSNALNPSTEKLSQRVDILEVVCGYDLETESSAAISKGCSDFILPSRRINQRLVSLEKAISQLNSDFNVMLKEGVVSFSKNGQNQSDDQEMDPFTRLMGAHELHTLLAPNNQYDSYTSDSEKYKYNNRRGKSRGGKRNKSPIRESSRHPFATPHPPGYRSVPTKTRNTPHRPVSAPSTKQQEHGRPAWQPSTPRNEGYTPSANVIRELYEQVHSHEAKINALNAEVRDIPRLDEEIIIMRIERRNAERDAAINDKLKVTHEQGKNLSDRIVDMTNIIRLDEEKKQALEMKIRQLETRLVHADSADEQQREKQIQEFSLERDKLEQRMHATQNEVRELTSELKKLNGENAALQARIDNERREKERIERTKNDAVDSLEFDKKMLVEQLQNVQSNVEAERKKSAELHRELEKQKHELREKMFNFEAKYLEEKQALDDKVYSLKREKELLEGENSELKRKLNKEIEDFGRRSSTITTEKDRLRQDLENDLEASKRRATQLEEEKARVSKTFEEALEASKRRARELEEEKIRMEREKREAESEKGQMSRDMEQMKQDMEFLKNQLAAAELNLAKNQVGSPGGKNDDKASPDANLGPIVFSPEQLRTLSKELASSFSAGEDKTPGPLISVKKDDSAPDFTHQFPTPYPHTKAEQSRRAAEVEKPLESDSSRQHGRHTSRITDSETSANHDRHGHNSHHDTSDSSNHKHHSQRPFSRSASREKGPSNPERSYQKQHSRQLQKQKTLSEEVTVLDEIVAEKEAALVKASEHKATIKAGIKEWINSFTIEHGRAPTVEDKESVSDLYIAHQEAALARDEAEAQLRDAKELLVEKNTSLAHVNEKLKA